jgi:hypothetical protein
MKASIIFPGVVLLTLSCCAAAAENGVKIKPGELVVDPPTLINLGFEWLVDGDDNHNAKAADFDFGLKPGSAAIDRGVSLPNVTDGFSGAALELGQAPPHYGLRS